MARIMPFKGLLYNVSKVSVEDVLAPPYDIITPEYREALYMQNPYNIVRIDFGKDKPGDNEKANKYTRARGYLDDWIREGVFLRSEKPSVYVYEMSYSVDGKRKKLAGILCLVKLEELGRGSIYPHECTYSKPKQDRLNLMRFCEANTSPIFSLYKSPEGQTAKILSRISSTKAYIESADVSGDIHRLWHLDAEDAIEAIQKELADKAVFIADGHHRYETAYEFSKERSGKDTSGTNPSDYVLMFLANMLDEGVTILPTHRLLKSIPENMTEMLSEYFDLEPVRADFDIEKRLSGRKHAFGLFQKGKDIWYILTYKGGGLPDVPDSLQDIDVIILHELIFKKMLKDIEIGYEMNIARAIEKIRGGDFNAALFLNPTKVEDVEKSALSSVRMPPKSTYFYPKLLTGLVINKW
jgi:uncharacterized protein (DUF1015 family)